MKLNQLEQIFTAEQTIQKPIGEVFQFFSQAENLQRITPPMLHFKILTPTPIAIAAGTLIDYQISVRGLPMKWRTRIELWEPPFKFVDVQLKGPYKKWHHTHEFIALDSKQTLMKDTVRYQVPLGWLGHAVAGYMIDRDVRNIFNFRRDEIIKIFAK